MQRLHVASLNQADGLTLDYCLARVRDDARTALGTPTLAHDIAPPNDPNANRVYLVGDVWHIVFGTEHGEYTKSGNKAIGWLVKILAAPNRQFTVGDLMGDPDRTIAADALLGTMPAGTREDLRSLKDALDDLDERARITGPSEILEEQRDALLREVARLQNATPMESALGRHHHNIASQLRGLREKLAKDMPRLAEHLTATLKIAKPHIAYCPSSGDRSWNL